MCIATTTLLPLHANKQSIAQVLGRTTDYVKNPEKTNDGEFISAYQCDPLIADSEFRFAHRQYENITGRKQSKNSIIAYHLRQSFKPGEITPELANKIGYDLAMSLTKGKNAFLVCTHVDKAHIHSHIVINSVNLDHTHKFRNFKNSSFTIRKISDRLCLENGLSVIEKPKLRRGHISNYSRTKDVYAKYKQSGWSRKILEQHEGDIIIHRAAKNYFDKSGYGKDKKLPKIDMLKSEYATLLAEKKKLYSQYKPVKENMIRLQTAKQNTDMILNLKPVSEHQRKSVEMSL